MPDTLKIILDSMHGEQSAILQIATDTLVHKIYNVSSESNSTKWIDYLKPSIDLLIALAGAYVLVSQYLRQKQKEFAERIIENKRIAYSEFLSDFTDTAVKVMHDVETGGLEDDKKRMKARNQLLLYANDKVIKAYHDWVNYADQKDSDVNKEVDYFGKILIEIRNDIHGESKVTDEQISNLNPFNRG